MRWLVNRPRRMLAGAFALALLAVVLGYELHFWLLGGLAPVMGFLLFFATLMALVTPRHTPRPPSPR